MPKLIKLPVPVVAEWANHAVRDISILVSRGTAPAYVEQSTVHAIGQRCVTKGGFAGRYSRAHDARRTVNVLWAQVGDVLVNSTGTGTIGRSCILDDPHDYIVDSHVTVIRPDPTMVAPHWIESLIRSPWGQRHLESYCYSGSTNQVELTTSRLATTAIPIPPLVEQWRIAEILDSVDESIRATEHLLAKLAAVRSGILIDLFASGDGRSRKGEPRWPILTLGSVADIAGGVALGRSLSGSGTVQLPYLRVANVQDGRIDISDIKYVRVLRSEVERYSLQAGDFLMTEGGDFDKLGRGAVWDGRISPCLHQNHIFRVRTDRSRLLPGFLAIYAGSHQARRYFVSASKQTTNLATINMTQVRAFPLPVPPLTEQERAIRAVSACDERAQTNAAELSKLRRLRQGLVEDLLTGRVRVNVKEDVAA